MQEPAVTPFIGNHHSSIKLQKNPRHHCRGFLIYNRVFTSKFSLNCDPYLKYLIFNTLTNM